MIQQIKDYFNRDLRKIKRQFRTTCRYSGIIQEYQSGKKKYKIYPIILDLKYDSEKIEIKLLLRNGMQLDKEKFILFCKQAFNRNTVIIMQTNNVKVFLITILEKDLAKFIPYDLNEYQQEILKKRVPLLLGYDHHQKLIVIDLKQYPHAIIGGSSGNGKSSLLRASLMAMIESKKPIDLFLCDMKMSELTLFRKVAKSVATNNQELFVMLTGVAKELNRRSKLLEQHEVLHIDSLNAKIRPRIILVVIDELALVEGFKENLKLLERISAIGRALNCYLIASAQRFDSRVITGFLKNNISVLISFKTANDVSSRTIGIKGAENLSIKGRCLVSINDQVTEVQVPFIDENQVKKLLEDYIPEERQQPIQENQINLTERPINDNNRLDGILGEGDAW